jgi:hypothetical protein
VRREFADRDPLHAVALKGEGNELLQNPVHATFSSSTNSAPMLSGANLVMSTFQPSSRQPASGLISANFCLRSLFLF